MYQKSRQTLVIPFLLPALLLYVLFQFVPLALTVLYSLTDWRGHNLARPFCGLCNYRTMLADVQFLNAARNTLVFCVSGAVILFIPALFIGWALTQRIKLKSVYRYIIIVPHVLPVVAVALLWKMLYDPVFGPLNNFLKAVGLEALAIPWLGNPRTALLAVVVAVVWQQLGMWVLLISAGLERIPPELHDCARIDGANEWQIFWKITMPMLWGVLRLLLVLWVIVSLKVFGQVYIMTPHGGAARSTDVMAAVIYERAFRSSQWAFASAMATVLLAVILLVSLTMNRVTRREVIEY